MTLELTINVLNVHLPQIQNYLIKENDNDLVKF